MSLVRIKLCILQMCMFFILENKLIVELKILNFKGFFIKVLIY